MTLVPALRLGVFVAVNTDTGGAMTNDLAGEIVQRFYAPAPVPMPAGSGLLDQRAELEGAWLSDARAAAGLEGFVDHFRRLAWVEVKDDHRLTLTDASGVSRWQAEAAGGRLHSLDGPRELILPGDGQPPVLRLSDRPLAYERAGFVDLPQLFAGLAATTLALCLLVLADFPVRAGQSFRESRAQGQAAMVQSVQSILWMAAMILFGLWAWQARDPAAAMYGWPGLPLIIASSCALVASILFLPVALLMPLVWRGGRRVESWSALRKLAFTLTSLVFLAFAVLLGLWGALQPWSA
jgi:hypothetical protein